MVAVVILVMLDQEEILDPLDRRVILADLASVIPVREAVRVPLVTKDLQGLGAAEETADPRENLA